MTTADRAGSSWLQSLARFGIRPGLNRTKRVLAELGQPEDGLRFFHVAGTNGKGSVCAMLASILSIGQRVGLFISPAFDGYRGRFSINGETISDDDFERLAVVVKEVSERVNGDDALTEFEALTIMAILYFHEQSVDSVVWETGLGGRLDSTNVVTPVVTAITNVGYDHVEILGPTLTDIAREKAGIIKSFVPVVTAATGEAYRVIERIAKEQESPLVVNGRSYGAIRESFNAHYQRMTYRGVFRDIGGMEIPLFGWHQCQNAATAMAMYEMGSWLGVCPVFSDEAIRNGLKNVVWPGRFEIFQQNGRTVIFDGAHNPDGARRFAHGLRDFCQISGMNSTDWTMVVGILRDKDSDAMLSPLVPLAKTIVVTAPKSPRALTVQELAEKIRKLHPTAVIEEIPNVADAMKHAGTRGNSIACWGSLYTVDEARKAIRNIM